MSDDLARRMADNQVAMCSASLARDAERLAASAKQYADDLKDGKHAQGGRQCHRAAQRSPGLAGAAQPSSHQRYCLNLT